MHIKNRLTIIAMVAILVLSGPALAADQASLAIGADSALDRIVEQLMVDAGIVGLGAAIIVDRKLVWMKGYGFADRNRTVSGRAHEC